MLKKLWKKSENYYTIGEAKLKTSEAANCWEIHLPFISEWLLDWKLTLDIKRHYEVYINHTNSQRVTVACPSEMWAQSTLSP